MVATLRLLALTRLFYAAGAQWTQIKELQGGGRCEFDANPRGFTTASTVDDVAACKAACAALDCCNSLTWDPEEEDFGSKCNLHTPPGCAQSVDGCVAGWMQPHDTKGSSPQECWVRSSSAVPAATANCRLGPYPGASEAVGCDQSDVGPNGCCPDTTSCPASCRSTRVVQGSCSCSNCDDAPAADSSDDSSVRFAPSLTGSRVSLVALPEGAAWLCAVSLCH